MINICVICGKEFEAIKSTKKYCSKDCENKMRREKYAAQQLLKKDLPKENHMAFKECLLCGKSFQPKTPAANQRQCCYECMPEGIQLKRSDFIAKLKIKEGGKCIKCGYDRCLSALDFHHKDPQEKEYVWTKLRLLSDSRIQEELSKCKLLCANCHRLIHHEQ